MWGGVGGAGTHSHVSCLLVLEWDLRICSSESPVLPLAFTCSFQNKVLDLDFGVVPSSLSQSQRLSNDKETIKCCLKFLLSFLGGDYQACLS